MSVLIDEARAALTSGHLAHLVTLNPDGSPQVTIVWVGLEGDEIPLAARICAVCDVFDALLSPRPYKDAWPLHEVIREISLLRGTHLDPALVDAFLPLAADLHAEYFEDEAALDAGAPGSAAA